MRRLLAALGLVLIVVGLLWAAQGGGLFPYPAQSFMIDQTPWVWRGLTLALLGAVLAAWGFRRR